MSAVLCGCGRATEAGRTVAHHPDCEPGQTCDPRCESVCGRCANDIVDTGRWIDAGHGNLRTTVPS